MRGAMVSNNIPPEAISAIVNLGIRLATTAIERRAQRPFTSMTASDVLRVVSEIEVRGVDELIEEGRKRAGTSDEEETGL